MSSPRRPLKSRPLDLLYFSFFLMHIPATLLIDVQALYPRDIIPWPISILPDLYLAQSGDPIIAGAFGLNGTPALWEWFRTFLLLEAVFQLPVFVIGINSLWKDQRAVYPLLLIYSASSATTTLACLVTLLQAPIAPTPALVLRGSVVTSAPWFLDAVTAGGAANVLSITASQRILLLASYVPFFLVPLSMCIDMALRVGRLVQLGTALERREMPTGTDVKKED